jgi:hypothetical protein
MPEFIVVSEDEPATDAVPVIVSAADSAEAIDKYLRKVYSKDEVFREGVLDRSIHMSFAERFFIVTDKEKRYFGRGTLRVDMAVVEERIRAYFSDNPSVGEKFIAYIQTGDEALFDDEAFEVIAASDTTGVAALEMSNIQRI